MEKAIRFILGCLTGVLLLGSFGSFVFAETLVEKDQAARQKYQSAREQYLKEVNFYKTSREQFLNAKEKYRKFKTEEDKTAYEEKARNYLEKTVDALTNKLEAMKNWVSTRRVLSETEKQSILAGIDDDVTWLEQEKAGIDNATPSEVKEKAKEIRDYWKNHRLKVKQIIAQVWVERLGYVIEKFEDVSGKITTKIAELKASGKDTAQLEAWLDDFNQKIALAKEKRDKAKEKYQAMTNLTEANQLFREVNQFIKEANVYLREAHQRLVEIVKEMRQLGGVPGTTGNSDANNSDANSEIVP